MPNSNFVQKIDEIREKAKQHLEKGAVTDNYKGDTTEAVRLLNDVLATETVCMLRYKSHYFMASGIHTEPVTKEFLEHARDEQMHADMIAERIVQLGGCPDFNPASLLSRSHSEFAEGTDLLDMIRINLIAERVAIASYREIIGYFGDNDPSTRRMLEEILAVEEDHAQDLSTLLASTKEFKKAMRAA
ncbi:MAG: ferritin-like domain-containing protein [Bdellovibrionota bacterium]